MPQSEEAAAWAAAVYETVQQIPYGKVTSYKQIAVLLDHPQRSRQVGVALKHLPDASGNAPYHNANVPWQRVINSQGMISPRGPGEAARQAQVLRSEGVEVARGGLGELSVSFLDFGWFPQELDAS